MNVEELKALLDNYPDDMEVFLEIKELILPVCESQSGQEEISIPPEDIRDSENIEWDKFKTEKIFVLRPCTCNENSDRENVSFNLN